jgi:hypothetical protein
MDLGVMVKRLDHGLWNGLMAQNIPKSADGIALGRGVHRTDLVPMIVGSVATPVDDRELTPAHSGVLLDQRPDHLAGRLPCG